MRLKKAEREEYLAIVRAYKDQKVIPIEEDDNVWYARFVLSKDHFARLTADLHHIVKISSDDLTEDYIREYSDEELDALANLTVEADKSLHYLSAIVGNDYLRRAKEVKRNLNHLKNLMQKGQTKTLTGTELKGEIDDAKGEITGFNTHREN